MFWDGYRWVSDDAPRVATVRRDRRKAPDGLLVPTDVALARRGRTRTSRALVAFRRVRAVALAMSLALGIVNVVSGHAINVLVKFGRHRDNQPATPELGPGRRSDIGLPADPDTGPVLSTATLTRSGQRDHRGAPPHHDFRHPPLALGALAHRPGVDRATRRVTSRGLSAVR